jgi:hypothetical protein
MNAKLKLYTIFLLGFMQMQLPAQIRLSGYVFDKQTGERLIGATVYEPTNMRGTITDNNGYFSHLAHSNNIAISYIGYQTHVIVVTTDSVMFIMLESGTEIDEISVYGRRKNQLSNVSVLSKTEMMAIPALGGKPDVLKSLQMMPGIQSQQEGTSHISVRGGAPGENLYLIDNVPLIYVNHLGGFTSVFNPDMINNIEVFKGGFPAKYGGKLSSIVAITQREGDKNKLKGALSYGLTDISGVIEGPLFDNNSSFIVTARKTLTDPLMMLASNLSQGGDFIVGYGFHDVNTKLSWRPNRKNSYFVNVYQGDDYLFYFGKPTESNNEKSCINNVWGNWLASARWNRILTPRLTSDNTFSVTRYRLKMEQSFEALSKSDTINFNLRYSSAVQDLSLRSDWQWKLSNAFTVQFGGKQTIYHFIPNQTLQDGKEINSGAERIAASETSAYVNSLINIGQIARIDAGGRLVSYFTSGYSEPAFEPRISVNISVLPNQTLNFTYQKVYQYAHLLFTAGSIMSNEVWVPAGKGIYPSDSEQFTIGWSGSFLEGMLEAELNLYTKSLNNLIMYREGYSNLMGDGNWRNKIETQGSGHSRGLELIVKKTRGNLTGFMAYTLSETTRQFEAINNSVPFVFDYDRPHSIAIHGNYVLSDVWSVSAAWVYHTGQPFTPVIGRQMSPVDIMPGNVFYDETLVYGPRNSERMIDYHRLDLGAMRKVINKKGRRAEWTYSVYNAYCRLNANAYTYGRGQETNSGIRIKNKLYKTSFFPIIPSVSYRVYFE